MRVEADARRYVPDGDGGTAPLYSRAFRLLRPVAARGLLPLFTQWGAGGDEAGFPAAVLNRVGKGKVVYIPAAVARDYDFNRMPAIRAFFGLVLREAAVETAVALQCSELGGPDAAPQRRTASDSPDQPGDRHPEPAESGRGCPRFRQRGRSHSG